MPYISVREVSAPSTAPVKSDGRERRRVDALTKEARKAWVRPDATVTRVLHKWGGGGV